jgi:hypothetical protein
MSTRRRVIIGVSIGLGVLLLVVLACAAWVGHRALVAKDALQAAQTQITDFKSALGQSNAPSTAQLYTKLAKNTGTAVEQTDDPLWSFTEGVPGVGPNLRAFRQVAELTDTLVTHGVQPIAVAADGISVDSLKPKNGALDIEPLKKLTPAMSSLDDALRAANASAGAIDTKGVLPQLKDPLANLQQTIQKVLPVTSELRKVMPVLYPALGGEGKRHYLLMFQNNAEERASGGNPASMAMLVVDHGKIKLGKQGDSGNFPSPYDEPPLTFTGDFERLYGYHTAAYLTNITFTPDFTRTARMARTMWRSSYGGTVDGVISFDPVALSYLLRATGPVKIATGETLTSDNAVPYLLNQVYSKYPDPKVQDAVFGSTAQSIFKAVTNGQGTPKDYLTQLTPMLNEQRLKMWSIRKDEEELLLTSQAGNMLPEDNTKATVFGVYNNDDATSKMSFYMDSTVHVTSKVCPAKVPQYMVTTKVTDTLKPDQVAGLAEYVKPHQPRIVPGGDRQWVVLYGPVGAKLVSASIDGEKVVWGDNIKAQLNTVWSATGVDDKRPAVKGHQQGRPVGIVSVKMGPLESVTVKALFTGGTDNSATIQVSHTPKVRPVPVTVSQKACS